MSKQYVIVIGRQFGSGGREIGVKLAEKLGIPLYDKTILAKVAEEQNISDERLRKMDEYLNAHRFKNIFAQAVTPIFGAGYLYETDTGAVLDREQVFQWQSGVIRELAAAGPCIIIGRCADEVLKDHPNLISVFVTAPKDAREERIAKLHPNHPREHYETHRQYIEKTDRLRAYYYNYNTGRVWGDINNYDLCVDATKLGIDGTVEMLAAYVNRRLE